MRGEARDSDRIITQLGMAPHPEGGHFVETFRDRAGRDGRALSTAILFLLRAGERSRWHRVDAAEAWHWHAGGPLQLDIAQSADGTVAAIVLGGDVLAGQVPQAIVPAHAWQQARPLCDWTLVGCTVSPGFEYSGFEMAPQGWEPALS